MALTKAQKLGYKRRSRDYRKKKKDMAVCSMIDWMRRANGTLHH
jgi:hypothetical protein